MMTREKLKLEIILPDVLLEELKCAITDIVQSSIPKEHQLSDPDEILSRKQVCKLLGITESTLWKRTKSGKIKSYGQGRRVYFKRQDVLNSLTQLK